MEHGSDMIDVRCSQCNKFLFAASKESDATIEIICPRCKSNKNPRAKRVIRLPFKAGQAQKPVASAMDSR